MIVDGRTSSARERQAGVARRWTWMVVGGLVTLSALVLRAGTVEPPAELAVAPPESPVAQQAPVTVSASPEAGTEAPVLTGGASGDELDTLPAEWWFYPAPLACEQAQPTGLSTPAAPGTPVSQAPTPVSSPSEEDETSSPLEKS